jgi:hypothetical protein
MNIQEALEILNETTTPLAVSSDLVDVVAFAKRQSGQRIKQAVTKLLAQFDSRERTAIGSFVSQLADALDTQDSGGGLPVTTAR